jgi:opacity protein-like surface antigen
MDSRRGEMKRIGNSLVALFFFSVAVSFVAVVPASAESNYIGAGFGIATYPDADLSVPGIGTAELSSDAGFMVGVALGTKIDSFRIEGEVAFRTNDGDSISGSGGSVSITGDVTTTSLLANGYIDIGSSGPIKPFIGAGMGFANVSIDSPGLADDSDTVFAYQFIAGVGISASPRTTIDLSYKYLGTSTPSFISVDGYAFDLDYSSHAFQVGIRYAF